MHVFSSQRVKLIEEVSEMFDPGCREWFVLPNGQMPLKQVAIAALNPHVHWAHAYKTLDYMKDVEVGAINTMM